MGVCPRYFYLGLQSPPFTAQSSRSLRKTAKVTLKGLRCANRSASRPSGWNLTTGPSGQLRACQGACPRPAAAWPGKPNPPHQRLTITLSQGNPEKAAQPLPGKASPYLSRISRVTTTVQLGFPARSLQGPSQLENPPPARFNGRGPLRFCQSRTPASASRNRDARYSHAAQSGLQGFRGLGRRGSGN